MTNLQVSIKSHLKPEKLMSFIIDFEYYKKFFPGQIKDIKILDRQNNAIITQENIILLPYSNLHSYRNHVTN